LQSLSARELLRNVDLAQASRETYSETNQLYFVFLSQLQFTACDLAEVLE
jgi:hypothetical protein